MSEMQVTILLTALRGLRNALLSAVDQIDVVLNLATQPSDEPEEKGAACTHPPRFRQPQPSMGHATRFLCMKCGQQAEG